jgi:hypothetical protein
MQVKISKEVRRIVGINIVALVKILIDPKILSNLSPKEEVC